MEGTQGCTAPNQEFGKIEVGEDVVYDVYCYYYIGFSIGSA